MVITAVQERKNLVLSRRKLLSLGLASGALLMIGGGAAMLARPVWAEGKLLAEGRTVMRAVARAVLDGSLPSEAAARSAALNTLMQSLEAALNNFPVRTQAEFAQLLGLLAHPWSRVAMGMSTEWSQASSAEVSEWLQAQRGSSLALKEQAYHALHDLTLAAWFSNKATWKSIGYELPVTP